MADTTVRNVTLQLHVPRVGEQPPTAFVIAHRGQRVEQREPIDGPTLRRALVRTHVIANLLVAYYCARLRAMLRARDDVPGGAAARRLIEKMLGDDDTSATNASRSLYKPLTDPVSKGFGLAAASESTAASERRNELLDELLRKPALIERQEVRALVAPTGRYPGCFERSDQSESGLRAKEPWNAARQEQLQRKVDASRPPSDGANPLVDLKRAGWIDAGSPHRVLGIAELLGTDPGRISAELGYGTFALAAARLATNRSWRKRRAEERAKQASLIEREFSQHRAASWWKDLDAYVAEAGERYARESGHAAKHGYQLGDGGELKGWGRIRRVWLKRRWSEKQQALPSFDELRRLRLAEQKLRPEEHGDHALFDWLAEPAQWHLWDGRDASSPGDRSSALLDRVGIRARHTRLARPMKGIDFTWPDPLRHPIWMAFGEGGGPNELPWHDLRPVGDDRGVTLGLLFVGADGKLEERDVRARMGENRRLTPAADGSPMLDGAHRVAIGGGKLMLHRPTLDRIARAIDADTRRLLVDPTNVDPARVERIVDAICGAPAARRKSGLRAYLGVALQLAAPPLPQFLRARGTLGRFPDSTVLGGMARFIKSDALPRPEIVGSGLRVLGVDLGVRFAAAFALVQLREAGGAIDRADSSERPRRSLAAAPEFLGCIERRGALKVDGEESERVPPRLERALRVVRFARRVVDRQNLAARVRRRIDELTSGRLNATAAAKEQVRLDHDLTALLPVAEAAPAPRDARPWPRAFEDIHDALALALRPTRAALDSAKTAEEAALAAFTSAPRREGAREVEAYLGALDRLAIATHRFARQAVAHPVAVEVGTTERARRAARKADARLPLPRVTAESIAMGGLSIARIEFLEEWLRYERKHATRSRRSADGEIHASRLTRAEPFLPRLRDRITRLKTDRCKKIAAMIVEAALGGRAGVLGDRKHPRADVIALEDLSRYKFFGDRSKRENRRLLAWSHREIFRWVVMQAELHGILVAAVPAGYSSRFSAVTGAPGARVEVVKAEWLDASWWKQAGEDARRNLGWRDAKAGDTVVKDGGPDFVGVGPGDRRVNADENAAANLALRFLSPPAQDPVYLRLERREDGTYEVTTSAGALMGTRFRRRDEGSPVFVPARAARARRAPDAEEPLDDETAADGERHVRVFRDPTGSIWNGAWVEEGAFWGIVRARVAKAVGVRVDHAAEEGAS